MVILGEPKNVENYICVNSKQSKELHKLGFQPNYRSIIEDKLYYIKSDKLYEVVNKIGF